MEHRDLADDREKYLIDIISTLNRVIKSYHIEMGTLIEAVEN